MSENIYRVVLKDTSLQQFQDMLFGWWVYDIEFLDTMPIPNEHHYTFSVRGSEPNPKNFLGVIVARLPRNTEIVLSVISLNEGFIEAVNAWLIEWYGVSILPPVDQRTHANDMLTPREKEVAHLLAQGMGDTAIAEKLMINPGTAKDHCKSISNKWGLDGSTAKKKLQKEAQSRGYGGKSGG